ncbi:hypothetical protein Tco_1507377 [Tanacetum coccineum]
MYYTRFTKVIIHYFLTQNNTVSWRNKIGMHTSKDDYLINTLRFVSPKEATQIYGVLLPESLASPEMKESKAYKTYLGFATGATPPKKARKFKKLASPQLITIPVSPEEPTGKSKRKENMTLEKRKGINLLYEVALTEEAQYEEARHKSLRDFHKTHISGSGTVTKTAPSVGNDKDDSNNEQDSSGEDSDQENDNDDDKTQSDNENELDSEHETDENESSSESDQEENEEDIRDDEEEVKDEFVKTPSNDSDDEDETKISDKAEGDEDEEMDYTTSIKDMVPNIWVPVKVAYDKHALWGISNWRQQQDIQCAGSDTRPPMLDKADFASWQQRIRLYCRGKDNGVNILKSIDEGPFQMGTTRVIIAEGTEGSLNLGPERTRVFSDTVHDEKDRVDRTEDRVIMQGVQVQLVMGEHRTEWGMLIQVKLGRLSATTATGNGVVLDEEQLLFLAGGQDNAIDEDVDEANGFKT